jgi:hypothetical protein
MDDLTHDGEGDILTEADNWEDRRRWFYQSRVGADGTIPDGLFARASAQRHAQLAAFFAGLEAAPAPPGGPGAVNWTPIGPSAVAHGQATNFPPVSGRIQSVVVGPAGDRIYAGSANGGVWLSTDGGASWTPLDDYAVSPSLTSGLEADSLSVGALAVTFGANQGADTIFVGTGEAESSLDRPTGDSYFGVGVKLSSSGGATGTWSLEATNLAQHGIFRIAVDPGNANIVYAASSRGLFQRPLAAPFTTWSQVSSVTFTNANGAVSDFVIAGSGGSKRYYAAFWGDAVYSSPNGTSWTKLTGIPGPGRISLACGENDPSVVYALTDAGNLFRLVGTAFRPVGGVPPATALVGSQGTYDLVVGVDPGNANTVYLAGSAILETFGGVQQYNLPVYKGTIAVSGPPANPTFTFPFTNAANPTADATYIGRAVHADAHSIAFATNLNGTHDRNIVWIGCDGGLFASTTGGALASFAPHNTGLAITEMTFLAQRADTDAVVYAGCQDNGNLRFWGEQAWFESPLGDGGGVAIDPNNPYRVMRQYVRAGIWFDDPSLPPGNLRFFAAALSRSTDGGAGPASWTGLLFPPVVGSPPSNVQKTAANTENGNTNFYTRFGVSPPGVSPTLVGFGTYRLWLTSDWGTTWVTLPTATNPYTASPPNAGQDVLSSPPDSIPPARVEDVKFASGVRIYAATAFAVWRFDQSGASWTRTLVPVAGLPSPRYITAIAVENAAVGSFYVAMGISGLNHVWYFDGAAWHAAGPTTATLDVPCHGIVVDPANTNNVYLGSDVGVWKGVKTGATTWTWSLFSQGLPEAAVTDLALHAPTRLLRAATHGRGVWEIPLDAASGKDPDIYLRVNYADTGRRFAFVVGAKDPTVVNHTLDQTMSADIKIRRHTSAGLPTLHAPPDYIDFAINIGDVLDAVTFEETADRTGANRIFVEVHNRSLMALPGPQVRVLLLLADASAPLPALPAGYAARINAGDTTNWVGGSGWHFADTVSPYRTLPGPLSVRTPQVVEYQVDFTSLPLPAGHDHACVAAFISTPTDQLTSNTTDISLLTMQDKHVAFRKVKLIGPAPPPSSSSSQGSSSSTRGSSSSSGGSSSSSRGSSSSSGASSSSSRVSSSSSGGSSSSSRASSSSTGASSSSSRGSSSSSRGSSSSSGPTSSSSSRGSSSSSSVPPGSSSSSAPASSSSSAPPPSSSSSGPPASSSSAVPASSSSSAAPGSSSSSAAPGSSSSSATPTSSSSSAAPASSSSSTPGGSSSSSAAPTSSSSSTPPASSSSSVPPASSSSSAPASSSSSQPPASSSSSAPAASSSSSVPPASSSSSAAASSSSSAGAPSSSSSAAAGSSSSAAASSSSSSPPPASSSSSAPAGGGSSSSS